MKKVIAVLLILFMVGVLFGDIITSHLRPTSDNALDIGVGTTYRWRSIYAYDANFSDELIVIGDANIYGALTVGGTVGASSFIGLGAALDDLAGLGAPASDGQFIVATGAGAFAYESGATARSSLGLGSIATQAKDTVDIGGGEIDGVTLGSIISLGILISSPAENSLLHVYAGDSGTAGDYGVDADMFVEDDDHVILMVVTPNDKQGIFGFADEDDTFVAGVTYDHSTDDMWLYANNAIRMIIDSAGDIDFGSGGLTTTGTGRFDGGIGVGTAPSAASFTAQETVTLTTGYSGYNAAITYNPTGDNASDYYGYKADIVKAGIKDIDDLIGFTSGTHIAEYVGTAGDIDDVVGFNFESSFYSTGASGTVDALYGFRVNAPAIVNNITINESYGIYLADWSSVGTAAWQIYSAGGDSYHAGKIALGQVDKNEYITGENDNYVDYGATTGHRINVGGAYEYTLPVADGSADEIIKTDGSGTLSFVRAPKAIYVELSDSTDQEFAVAGEPNLIVFDTNDEIAGITHSTSSNPENITIITTGVYTIFAQPQIATGAGGAGKFHMWLQKNTGGGFVDIANTNIELSLASQEENVIPLATTFLLSAGDVIRLSASVSDIRIKLHAQTPVDEPAIPSIIFTMFMIGT